MNDKIINENLVSGALNSVSDRHIRENDIELLTNGGTGKRRPATRIMRIMTAAAACAAVFGIGLTAGAAATDGFTSGFKSSFGVRNVIHEPSKLPVIRFAAENGDEAPKTIEQTYAPTLLKEGVNYRINVNMGKNRNRYNVEYIPDHEDLFNSPFFQMNYVDFLQRTKAEVDDLWLIQKFVDIKEITVSGCPGYVVSREQYNGTYNIIIWDNGDYIFTLHCKAPLEEAVKIAESVAPCDETTGEVLA